MCEEFETIARNPVDNFPVGVLWIKRWSGRQILKNNWMSAKARADTTLNALIRRVLYFFLTEIS